MKGCNGWQIIKRRGFSASLFVRIYWHLFHTMSLTLLGLRIFGWLFLECGSAVRQCRTIERPWPRNSESRAGFAERCRDRKQRPRSLPSSCRRRPAAWQDVLGTRPFQQYDGPGPSEPTNNGHPTPHFKAGLHQVGAMRADDNRGKGLKFVDSMGNVLGDFGVTGITETRHDIGPACRSGPNFG